MAGKTRYELAKEALKDWDGEVIHVNKLKLLIMKSLSSTEEGIRAYCRMLESCGIIKEVEHYRFKVDLSNDYLENEMKEAKHYRKGKEQEQLIGE